MYIEKGLTSMGLFGFLAMMLYYKINPYGIGTLLIFGLLIIWNGVEKKE